MSQSVLRPDSVEKLKNVQERIEGMSYMFAHAAMSPDDIRLRIEQIVLEVAEVIYEEGIRAGKEAKES